MRVFLFKGSLLCACVANGYVVFKVRDQWYKKQSRREDGSSRFER